MLINRIISFGKFKFSSGLPRSNSFVCNLFLRALGLIYLIAFVSIGFQILGLIGLTGILPATDYLQAAYAVLRQAAYWRVPTLFWLNSSDAALQIVPVSAAILALLVALGYVHRVIFIILFIAYLSLVSAGQVFMAFQWDILLLEAGFLAIFVDLRPSMTTWLFRWLLFRLLFLSGLVKLLSGDPTWRNLTALTFHYETQPLPTIFGWMIHQAPLWFHQFSVIAVFFFELAIPFLFFGPRRLRLFAAAATIFFQLLIFLTGNYGFFNLLTIALCLFLFDEADLRRFMPQGLLQHQELTIDQPPSAAGRYLVTALTIFIVSISAGQMLGLFLGRPPQPVQTALSWIAPFRIINSYGLFAIMTTTRPEITIEGSLDGETWLEYEFQYKAGDSQRAPVWAAPHQPRLDWQLWFAALGNPQPWFINFMARLQQGSPQVEALLANNPFPDAPPRYVRAWLDSYRFTNFATLRAEGRWWQRERTGLYFPDPAFMSNP